MDGNMGDEGRFWLNELSRILAGGRPGGGFGMKGLRRISALEDTPKGQDLVTKGQEPD